MDINNDKDLEQHINGMISNAATSGLLDSAQVSDGYHTFEDLYNHRHRLFIALCRQMHLRYKSSVSERNHYNPIWHYQTSQGEDGHFEGYFLMGIHTEYGKQISYHLPDRFINEISLFSNKMCIKPTWDGHTSQDVLERLALLL